MASELPDYPTTRLSDYYLTWNVSSPHIRRAALTLLLAVVLPPAADAQGQLGTRPRLQTRAVPEVGIRGGYEFDLQAVSIGAQFRLPVGPLLELVPSGDYFFADGQTAWQGNLDLVFRVGFRQALYGGLGLAMAHRAFKANDVPQFPEETKPGINLFAGLAMPRFRQARIRPYAEVRWTFVTDFDTQLAVLVGVNLGLGGGGRR